MTSSLLHRNLRVTEITRPPLMARMLVRTAPEISGVPTLTKPALPAIVTSAANSVTRLLYQPIPDKDVIRILTLFPGAGQDALNGSLDFAVLKDSQDYEALSYAWGSPQAFFSITINKHKVPITHSVYAALLRLRNPHHPRRLWIDALCINQADTAEKSVQVSAMSRIYSCAQCVLCWLGEDSDGDGLATMELLRRLGDSDFPDLVSGKYTNSIMRSKNLPEQGDPQWDAACRFLLRPWFTRSWVLQEFILGRRVHMVCGESEVSWRTMQIGLENVHTKALMAWGASNAFSEEKKLSLPFSISHVQLMLSFRTAQNVTDTSVALIRHAAKDAEFQKRFHDALLSKLANFSPSTAALLQATFRMHDAYSQICHVLGIDFNLDEDRAQMLDKHAREFVASTGQVLDFVYTPAVCDLMHLVPFCTSSDMRDRFFALLSLSGQKENPCLQPDYSESIESTYIRFGRYFLLHPTDMNREASTTGVLDLLCYAGTAHRVTSLDLPSWIAEVPTSYKCHANLLTGHTNVFYNATGNSTHKCRDTGDTRTISIAGGIVDVVTRVIRQPYFRHGACMKSVALRFQEFFRLMDELAYGDALYLRLTVTETFEQSMWRVLIANVAENLFPARHDYHRSYLAARFFFRKLSSGYEQARLRGERFEWDSERLTDTRWVERWQSLTPDYSVCETRSGLLGLVPNGSQVGDSICLFLGESLPFVVRSVHGPPAERHQIVGACYIDRIMQGEAMQSDEWHEREFCLM